MRYLIFAGESYYPVGGSGDLVAISDDKDKSIEYAISILDSPIQDPLVDYLTYDWVEVFDTKDLKSIYVDGDGYGRMPSGDDSDKVNPVIIR